MSARDWRTADRVSDRIVAVLNSELEAMRREGEIEPFQLLAGHLLALLAIERTMPATRPPAIARLMREARTVLNELAGQ